MAENETQRKTPRRPEKGHEAGLIPLGCFEPDQLTGGVREDGHTLAEYRRRRFRRRAEAQRREYAAARRKAGLSPNDHKTMVKTSSATFCGRPLRGVGGVSVKSHDGHAHFSGLARCGNVWRCPVCSQIVRHQRAEELAEGARRAIAAGGTVALATFTVRHDRSDSLETVLGLLGDAYASMSRSRAYRAWRDANGLFGQVTALELPYGVHGWHCHRHVALFFDGRLDPVEQGRLGDELFEMWSHAVGLVGGRTVAREAFDFQIVGVGSDSVAAYMVKDAGDLAGLGKEVSLGDLKAGRSGSIAAFELLDDDSAEAHRLWNEYVEGTRGRSAIRWSRGLRARLGLGKERTDEQVAQEADAVGDVSLTIDADVFAERVARKPQVMAGVLEAVERHDLEAAARLVGVPLSWEVWPGGELMPRLTRRPSRLRAA